jgi:hypothetical protein
MRPRSFAVLLTLLVALAVPVVTTATPFTTTYTFTGSLGNQVSEPVDSNPVAATFSPITRGPGVSPVAGLHSINSDAGRWAPRQTSRMTFTNGPSRRLLDSSSMSRDWN